MAAMTITLTEFSDKENSRTYTLTSHTAVKPALVIQKRRVPSGNATMARDTISIIRGTVDADGAALPQKSSMSVSVDRPIDGADADVTSNLADLRDIVASDEFAAVVSGQLYLK